MKRNYNLLLLGLLIITISCVSESSQNQRSYKKMEILYDIGPFPWQFVSVMSLTPYQYLEYTPDILKIEVKDSAILSDMEKHISELHDKSRSFDTWFVMIAQDENDQLDTIGFSPSAIWKNAEVYKDTTLVDFAVEIIVSKDSIWRERLDKYKKDGKYQIRSAGLIDAGIKTAQIN